MNKLIIFLIIFFVAGCSKKERSYDEIVPKTEFPVYPVEEKTPQRIKDLTLIVYALEKYKLANNQYPISSGSGKEFDGLYGVNTPDNQQWIKGLVPKYIDKLPSDPRNLKKLQGQYLYKSNGANYKLLASSPDDCEYVKVNYKNLFQQQRDCWAYGYWTIGASSW